VHAECFSLSVNEHALDLGWLGYEDYNGIHNSSAFVVRGNVKCGAA
jgi:hypothetical protein